MRIPSLQLLVLLSFVAAPASASAQADFERLGVLPGTGKSSFGTGLSADGAAISGYSFTSATTYRGFHWTAATGLVDTGDLAGAEDQAFNNAMSPDGTACAGGSRTQDDSYWQVHATLYDGIGLLDLGTLPYITDGWSIATDLSDRGDFVVGYADHGDGYHLRAFRWSPSGMDVIDPIAPWLTTIANGVSADGSVVVGRMTAGTSADDRAFVWTATSGLQDLGGQSANNLSPDGTMVLGINDNAMAAYWTAQDGWVELAWGAWGPDMGAYAASSDHGVIVGRDGYHAFYRTPEGGTRWLEDVLATEHGVDLGGWMPLLLGGMSDDGTVISGSAYEVADANHWEAFRCVVPRTSWQRLGNAMAGTGGVEPQLYGRGDLAAGGRGFLAVEKGRGNAPVIFIVGATALNAPLFKGTLVPSLDLIVPAQLGWFGDVTIGGALPSNLPPGVEFYAQAWIADAGAPKGFSATNAMKGVTQ